MYSELQQIHLAKKIFQCMPNNALNLYVVFKLSHSLMLAHAQSEFDFGLQS